MSKAHLLSRATSFFSCIYHNNPRKEVLLFLNYQKKKEENKTQRLIWLSHSVISNSLPSHGLQPIRLLCPWGFSRQEYWSGSPFPSPRDLPNPEIGPKSPSLQADSLPTGPPGKLTPQKRRIRLNDWFNHQKKCHSRFINIHFFFINVLFCIGV